MALPSNLPARLDPMQFPMHVIGVLLNGIYFLTPDAQVLIPDG
jgi:hypothetical protein